MPLKVTSRPIELAGLPTGDFLFARSNQTLIGQGVALRLSAKGKDRIASLAKKWQEVCAEAEILDGMKLPGSSLVAFSSITFSENSQVESVLVVPKRLYVIRPEASFVIEVEAEEHHLAEPCAPTKFEAGKLSPAGFTDAVSKAIRTIEQTELKKVVLSRDLEMVLPQQPDLTEPLARLRARYPECWTYKVEGVFGASPELLLRAERGEVSARVLAGTAGRGTDPDVDRAIADGLSHSIKNNHEHGYAVQSMVSELEPFCEWVEADAQPFSLALPDLWHLATDVRGKLKPATSLLDVIAKLHPTAAVAGTPRELAIELIEELEPYDRGGYAGPVGWVSADGSGELAIALRGGIIETQGNQVVVRAIAGCGIVAESDPQAELAETELKFRAVRYAFEN
jgi:menaquinone-specific isochorismate synthase